MTTNTKSTWCASQALFVVNDLTACIDSRLVKGYFNDDEKAAMQVLLDKAKAGHALALAEAWGHTKSV